MKEPSVSVIILNYNGFEDTSICLKSLLKLRYSNFKLIVVDNCSDKNELSLLSSMFSSKKIAWVKNKKNLGFAKANNEIIKKEKSKYVALLNNDTEVHSNWLKTLVKVAESNKEIAVCQSKVLSFYKRGYFEYAGAAGGLIDGLGYPYARGRIGFHLEKDIGQYDSISEILWASGTAMLIRRNVFEKVGYFPEDFFAYHEETDLCWRIKDKGYGILFVPQSVIFHKGSRSFRSNLYIKIFYVHRNHLLLISRNFSSQRLFWVLPLRIMLDYASCLYYIVTKNPSFVMAVLQSHVSFFVMIPRVIRYRLSLKLQRPGRTEKLLSPTSIYWEYFIKKKTRFSEIVRTSKKTETMRYKDMIRKARRADIY